MHSEVNLGRHLHMECIDIAAWRHDAAYTTRLRANWYKVGNAATVSVGSVQAYLFRESPITPGSSRAARARPAPRPGANAQTSRSHATSASHRTNAFRLPRHPKA
ncbi:hypothetical protein EVAR_83655_1 [Eumeta japonica]|uniref:Uncharacterized protein n=1 Tax=Eumeta variegata TaxID=151549 RepID=A0A4C1UQA3_EUMVA|nr:hypothetical protein EVAR_83655_1 [Eumeta japonica]